MNPLISVIIPTCHRNDLLAKCLDCLAPGVQTLPADQYEVIVSDDGSKSTAEKVVREQYPWARWVAGPRRGPAANRNNGAKFAEGKWLAFTDDDCLPSLRWLEIFVTSIKPGVFVCEGKTTCIEFSNSIREIAPINLEGGVLWSCNFAIEKRTYDRLRGFDEAFPHPHLEDVDLRERIRDENLEIAFISEALIDHPPRRERFGQHSGLQQESEIYFWYKRGNTAPAFPDLARRSTKHRLRKLLKCRSPIDITSLIISSLFETGYVLTHIYQWEVKYRKIF